MDANGTRHHLLQGQADWARFRPSDRAGGELAFDAARGEITLWPQVFRFPAGRDDRPVSPDDRRGTARDALGNWYWIAADRQRVMVRSEGDDSVGVFWPQPVEAQPPAAGGFGPVALPPSAPPVLQGLAVTDDHQLVVGRVDQPGLLAFDLVGGGAPRAWRWPLAFEPWDLAPRPGGGVWVLDRRQRRLWPLDSRLEAVTTDCDVEPDRPDFHPVPASGTEPRGPQVRPRVPLRAAQGRALAAADPQALGVLPDGAVLLLDEPGDDGFARLWLVEPDGRTRFVSTADLLRHVAPGSLGSPARWVGQDLAVCARDDGDPPHWRARVHVVGADGNQAFAFGLADADGVLFADAQPLYQPMRLFGGRALVAAGEGVFYDCGADASGEPRFIALVAQPRTRWVEQGEALTPVLDSGEPGCVWHRVVLDGRFPPGCRVQIDSRCADDWRLLVDEAALTPAERAALGPPPEADAAAGPPDWQREPDPAHRPSGSEQPWQRADDGRHAGHQETLLQRAQGRYLQLRLVLSGNGRATPRVRALRVHHPRFSYLARYLPAVYRDDADSAHFLDRFLANPEGLLTSLEDRIAAAQVLWDPRTTPPEALDWLAGWFGVLLDPAWNEARRRFFLRHAMRYFARRGTLPGLRAALALALDECVDERLFERSEAERPAAVRIVEHFRRRHTPAALMGAQAVDAGVALPSLIDPARRWTPALGAAELLRRWRLDAGGPAATTLPLRRPVDASQAARWEEFCLRELGFVPQAGSATEAHRAQWQAFLVRRYRQPVDLAAAWRQPGIRRFADAPLPTTLPPDGAALADWCRFEGTALAMHAQAHRFTVLLPVPPRWRTDTAAQQRRLLRARRVLELEKPAHTVFEVRFYWAAFRLGAARLGSDTLVDLGSRAPQLMTPMVLGQGALAQSHLATPRAAMPGFEEPGRLQLGRDRVGRSTRL
jgi:phage tail-like protein